MGKYLAGFAAFLLGWTLLKDGTIPGLARDAAKGLGDFATGIKPLTNA